MSTIATTETPEAKELNLVGKVELRIALAESDVKLQSILNTYLPPLLLKLASEFVSVRNKVGYSRRKTMFFCICIEFLGQMYRTISLQVYMLIRARLINLEMLGYFCLSTYQYKSQGTVCPFHCLSCGFTWHALYFNL